MATKVTVNRLTNANIYIDGNNSIGKAEEITCPVVKFKTGEHKALGMLGSFETFSGIDKMEAKIKWNCFYPDVMKKFSNPFKQLAIMVRGSLETYDSSGRSSQIPVVIYMNCQPKDFPTGTFKQNDNVELENNITVYYVKMEIDGAEIVEVDVLSNIYKVDGVDMLADYRNNLGI